MTAVQQGREQAGRQAKRAADRIGAAAAAGGRKAVRKVAIERLALVPHDADVRRYAMPGVARSIELRWRRTLRQTPAMSLDAYGATVAVGEIEELLACQLCGGTELQPLFSPTRPGRWTYHVVRCARCGFLYRNPGVRPERLGDLYSRGNYAKFLEGHYGRGRQRGYRRVMKNFSPLFAANDGRRLLDFGCGAGLFLELAHGRGFDAWGVDLSPDSVAAARARPGGHHAFLGAPEDVPEIAAGGFDVVTMWSVLAHLPRPVEVVESLRRLLTPEGVLLISTVNANSLTLKAHGERWGGFTPNHLVFFSPVTLAALLRMAGFGAVLFRPMYGEALEGRNSTLRPGQRRRLRRTVDRGNQGRMLRAAAFVAPDGARRWGFKDDALRL